MNLFESRPLNPRVSERSRGDAPVLPDLLAQILDGEKIASVGGDSAYDSKNAMRPLPAVMLTRLSRSPQRMSMERGWPGVQARNETLRAIKKLGRTIWKKWSGYRGCSLLETKMHGFKLLGQRVMART